MYKHGHYVRLTQPVSKPVSKAHQGLKLIQGGCLYKLTQTCALAFAKCAQGRVQPIHLRGFQAERALCKFDWVPLTPPPPFHPCR